MKMTFNKVIALSVLVGAMINLLGIVLAVVVAGKLSFSPLATLAAVALALIATSAIDYVSFVAALRRHFQKEAEDKLLEEIAGETDLPRRFDEVNFK